MRRSSWLWSISALVYAFLYVPLIIVVVYSFNDSRLNAEWVGFTLDWYVKLFHNEKMLTAAWNSLVIGVVAILLTLVTVVTDVSVLWLQRRALQFWLINLFGPEVNIGNARLEELGLIEAEELGVTRVIVPRVASGFCAFGEIISDVKHNYLSSYAARMDQVDPDVLNARFEEMETTGRTDLIAEGFLGNLLAIDLRMTGSAFVDQSGPLTWRLDRELSGSNTMMMGI